MTVKELKEKLKQFPDDSIILVPNIDWEPGKDPYVRATDVYQGMRHAQGYVFIDDDDMNDD